jgi:hypothetical protein
MMRFNQSDIIEDVLAHIRQCGGECSEWCVWTAKHSAFLGQHGPESAAEGLIYREAYTPYAAAEVMERLAGCGLRPERGSAAGSIVFAYHLAVAAAGATTSHSTTHKLAA